MTLLDKATEAIDDQLKQHWLDRSPADCRSLAEAVLRSVLSTTQAQVNHMGARALAGPQPAIGHTIYPAEIWRAGILYILEERDRAPEPEEQPEENPGEDA